MSTEQTYDCVFCKEAFNDKEALQIHFRKHGDPKFNKISKSKGRTQNDEISNEKSTEDNEMVGCDVCEEVFPTISKAITHKHKIHPDHDAKYFCSFCGKVFTMKHLYNKHILTNHNDEPTNDSKDFYCECCEVAFYVAPAMLYHNKFFHRQDSELATIGQSKKVKLYNQELLQIFFCAFCGEEYNNKINLHKHMGDDHSDENQSPNEVLRCPLCEAVFYHLDAFEVHLTFHSVDDLYSEKNEIAESITDFSLETVPPIMEKVEDDQQPESNVNDEGIDSFLQLVMNESEPPEKVKSKKHKKHKKSKKAAITLDEFLNMNKDVFGDGLDVQGIEEVPTPFVLKKPKVKKITNKVVNADLAKLKKIGITVKTKGGNPVMSNVKKTVATKINTPIPANLKSKPNTSSSPSDIISKLMNQGNSQIKIVKKTVSQNPVIQNAMDNDEVEPAETSDKEVNNSSNQNKPIENEDDGTENNAVVDNTPTKDVNVNSKPVLEAVGNSNTYCNKNEGVLENVENISFNTNNTNKEVDDKSDVDPKTSEANIPEHTSDNDNNWETPENYKSNQNMPAEADNMDNPQINFKDNLSSCEENQEDDEKETENVACKTLNALKHLSHLLTVKPVSNTKNVINNNEGTESDSQMQEGTEVAKETKLEQKIAIKKSLRNLSEHLTIKPAKSSPSLNSHIPSDAESEDDQPDSDFDDDDDDNIPTSKELLSTKLTTIPNQVHSPHRDRTSSPNTTKANYSLTNKPLEPNIKNEECPKKIANLNILKRLTNVTAKPVVKTNQQTFTKVNKNTSLPNIKQNNANKGKIDEEIEVFNIDDSDSEDNEKTTSSISTEVKKNNVPLDTLKSLNKNITVKNQQTNMKVNTYRAETSFENYTKFNKQTPEIQKSINIQNKLKNFGSHITVKSRNSSPINRDSKSISDPDDANDEQGYDSGSDDGDKLKITEVNEDHPTDEEFNENEMNAMVESPNGSQREHEEIDEDNTEKTYENSKATPLTNQNDIPPKVAPGLESLKNLNKELTIKSLTKNCDNEENSNQSRQKDIAQETKNTNKELVLKQFKQKSANEQTTNKTTQQAGGSMSESFNQKVSTSSNQVTKTVKRFQSKTVIEEITTTVTKTIRTVNQSSNEEVQSTSQYSPRPTIRPQKVINRLPQPGREFQGKSIRHVTPTVGTKIRSTGTAIRSPKPSVRPSNQLVPIRPTNLIRPALPSPSAIRKPAPQKSSPQRSAIGKLKISPNAISQTLKRPSEEVAHYSNFKKPKEFATLSSDFQESDEESMTQFSASQSQTKFSSVTKTVKGQGGVTATQMKSEVSSSSQQQLSKLSSVSGLKIVKTGACSKVEEKCEMTSVKKNTMEALEKLQKQGLLIKKPRIDECSEPTNSFSESDDDESEND